jgi:hypothetical protein
MMKPVLRVDGATANPVEGHVAYDFPKLLWNMGMMLAALIFGLYSARMK